MSDVLDSIRRHRQVALGIARSVLSKLPRSVPREDVEQAALIGLFKWKRSHPDETAAGWAFGLRTRIRGSIGDELRRQDWLPRSARREGASPLRVIACDDVDPHWEQTWAGASDNPEAVLERKQQYEAARQTPMSRRDARILDLHYLGGVKFQDIGTELGCSEPRISQLHSHAIKAMRAHPQRANEGAEPVRSTLPEEGINLRAELARYQDWMVEQALIRTSGNKARAAKLLGLERTTLVEMLKRGCGSVRVTQVVVRKAADAAETPDGALTSEEVGALKALAQTLIKPAKTALAVVK